MRRRVAIVVAACLVPAPTVAHADVVGTTGDPESGNIDAAASTDPIVTSGGSGGSVCDWDWMTVGEVIGLAPPQGGPPLSTEELAENSRIDIDGTLFGLYHVVCPGLNTIRLVDLTITPGDLIPALYDEAGDVIELPDPFVNPPVNTGGVVNLGMWLAVQEASYLPITAEAGPVFITVTPQIASTTFSFGNGDEVVCTGFGVPIVDLDSVEAGPCGYTYLAAGDYILTITSTWNLPYTSSSGPGALTPMDRTVTFPYEVVEIQTVGTSG